MAKILALDLGTNSIGWAVTDTVNRKIDAGVTTFQQGVNLSNEEPLNVAKRKARQQKRQVFYKDYRLTKMTEVLARFGMFPFLKSLESQTETQIVIKEIALRYSLNKQQLKNFKLNKYKDAFQLNARIAKLLLLHGIAGIKTETIDFEKYPATLDDFIHDLVAFISLDPYKLRSVALTDNISKMEFGRILYQFGKRRGFKSSRKVKNQDEGEDAKFQFKTFKKNNKKKDWQEEIKKIKESNPDTYEITKDTDEEIIIKFPKRLTEFYLGIEKTKEEIKKWDTLGNYLFHKNSHEERIRQETRTDRAMYVHEFNVLWGKHAERLGLNVLSGEKRKRKKSTVDVSLNEFIGDKRKGILFYQRPLKSQKHLVAICNFSNKNVRLRNTEDNTILLDSRHTERIIKIGKARCLLSHPRFEYFRALQQINNLKIKRASTWERLSGPEGNILLDLFINGCNETGKVSISKVLKALEIEKHQLKGASENDVENGEEERKDTKKKKTDGSFAGNYTMFKLSTLFGEKWNNPKLLPKNTYSRTVASCKRDLGGKHIKHDFEFKLKSPEERKNIVIEKGEQLWNSRSSDSKSKLLIDRVQEEIWHCFSFYEDDELLFSKLCEDFGLEEDKKDELRIINLKAGYGSFSLKTINKLIPFMEKGIKQTDAIFLANIDDVFGKEGWNNLSSEKKEKIYKDIENYITDKQQERKENELLNACLKFTKDEIERKDKNEQILNDVSLKSAIHNKLLWFLRDELEIIDGVQIDKKIDEYSLRLKILLKNPLQPKFIAAPPVEDEIKAYLKDNFNIEEPRLEHLWHSAKVEQIEYSPEELQEPKFQTLRNPIVKQALYALRSAVKAIEKKHGKPDIVRIELARELNDKNRRIAIRKWQKRKQDENTKAKNELSEYSGVDSDDPKNILKYKLWKELEENKGCHICPYTGKSICFTDLFDDNKFEVEHIIPRSRCWSDAEINLTLCETNFNGSVKKDFTPFEIKDVPNHNFNQNWFSETKANRNGKEKTYWHYSPLQGWRKKAQELSNQIEQLEERIKTMNLGDARDKNIQDKYLRKFERDYYQGKYRRFTRENVSKELDDEEDFMKSLITDTSYITKLAATYLKSYYGETNVETVKGSTTSMLREEWDLGEKDRSKHYHHAEDAILISFTDRKLYQNLAQHRKKEKELGKFNHPWGIDDFKDKVAKAVFNIAVYSKQRNKKITQYKKTIQLKGDKKKVNILSVRGELHEPNPSGQIRFQNNSYTTHRYKLSELMKKDWNKKIKDIPVSLKKSWKERKPETEEKTLTKVWLQNEGKYKPLSQLKFNDIVNIEKEEHRELISQRIKEKGLENNSGEDLIPKGTLDKIIYNENARGGEFKTCKIIITEKGKEQQQNRKLSKEKWNLKFSEIPAIIDEVIKDNIITRLFSIVPEKLEDIEDIIPEDSLEYTELFEEYKVKLKDDNLAKETAAKFIRAIWTKDFATLDKYNFEMPNVFFKSKIYRDVLKMGIPIKKITFKERDENGRKVRKYPNDLVFGDIPNISEPAQTIIRERLKELNIEIGNSREKLPLEFFNEGIYVPVKNVRTHVQGGDLYPIRKGNYFRFGNIDHVIIYQEPVSGTYYIETVPFYFVVNPKKYNENDRLQFIQGIGKKEIQDGNFEIEKLKEVERLRKGDYFILFKRQEELNKLLNEEKYSQLKENIYKVTMISSTSFDIQFRKHYAAKSDVKEENKHIQSSQGWVECNPIKVKITPTGKIEKITHYAQSHTIL